MIRGPGRPKKGYRNKAGERVPSVTTILGRWKESGGLIHWSWQCGMDGIDYRKVRDSAADTGTLAHEMIEAEIHGDDPKAIHTAGAGAEKIEAAYKCLEAFRRWVDMSKLVITHSETPLVSEKYQFAGCPDHIGSVGDRPSMVDIKTGNTVYPEYLLQAAAYILLWDECMDCMLCDVHLLRLGKEFADFHHHSWSGPVIEMAKQQFLRLRECYDADKLLKRAV